MSVNFFLLYFNPLNKIGGKKKVGAFPILFLRGGKGNWCKGSSSSLPEADGQGGTGWHGGGTDAPLNFKLSLGSRGKKNKVGSLTSNSPWLTLSWRPPFSGLSDARCPTKCPGHKSHLNEPNQSWQKMKGAQSEDKNCQRGVGANDSWGGGGAISQAGGGNGVCGYSAIFGWLSSKETLMGAWLDAGWGLCSFWIGPAPSWQQLLAGGGGVPKLNQGLSKETLRISPTEPQTPLEPTWVP